MRRKQRKFPWDDGIEAAIAKAGGMAQLAADLGISYQAIQQWKRRVPAERLLIIEAKTGVPRDQLRPDLFKGYTRAREPA